MKLNDAIKNGLKLTDLEKRCLQRLIDQEYYNDDEDGHSKFDKNGEFIKGQFIGFEDELPIYCMRSAQSLAEKNVLTYVEDYEDGVMVNYYLINYELEFEEDGKTIKFE